MTRCPSKKFGFVVIAFSSSALAFSGFVDDKALRQPEMRFGHVGIDLQRVLITRDRFRLVVFFLEQVAPNDECFRISRIGLGHQLQDIVGVVKVFGCRQRARDP